MLLLPNYSPFALVFLKLYWFKKYAPLFNCQYNKSIALNSLGTRNIAISRFHSLCRFRELQICFGSGGLGGLKAPEIGCNYLNREKKIVVVRMRQALVYEPFVKKLDGMPSTLGLSDQGCCFGMMTIWLKLA
jgi:hypothetical protein